MLNEYKKLIPTKKEMKLQIYINQLINDLYSNKKIEVDSKKLLELLSYLTSNENISTQMKTATEYQNRKIADILHIKEVEYLKRKIKYLKENSIPKQKVKDKMKEIKVGEYGRTNKGKIFIFAWLENSDEKRYTNKVLLGNGKIFENKFYYFDDGEEIVKHSKNIIDLIEVGDIVHTRDVLNEDIIYIWTEEYLKALKEDLKNGIELVDILTKEQYESNCYTVEQ